MSDQVSGARDISGPAVRGVLPIGTRLGPYEIVLVLGQGGFGITYRARDEAHGRDVAIKEYFPASLSLREGSSTVVPRSSDATEEFVWGRERFVEEERTLSRLADAPAVVRVLDFIEANGTAYMVMALVEGETLHRQLERDGKLSQAAVERLLTPLLDGLEQVHAAGYLHRDIKPGNIIVDAEGRPTLIDFGAARAAMVGRTQTLTAVFTPGYAPIEQFTSGKQGPCTDIYALGATLYQCVTGSVPPSAIERMIADEIKPAVETGRGAYDAKLLVGIDAALIPQASMRPQNIAEWREVFATGSTPQSSAVTMVLPKAASSRPSRRPLWVGAAGAVLLVALAGGSYLALRPAAPTGPSPTETAAQQKAAEEAVAKSAADDKARADLEQRLKESETTRQRLEAEKKAQEAEKKAQEEAQQKAQEEAQRKAQEEARLKAEQEQNQKSDEEARRKAEANDKNLAEAVETGLKLSLLDRQHIQVALTSLGFNTGGTDGVLGQRSREAIAAWQKAHKFAETSFLNGAEQQALLGEASRAVAKFDEDLRKVRVETPPPPRVAAPAVSPPSSPGPDASNDSRPLSPRARDALQKALGGAPAQ